MDKIFPKLSDPAIIPEIQRNIITNPEELTRGSSVCMITGTRHGMIDDVECTGLDCSGCLLSRYNLEEFKEYTQSKETKPKAKIDCPQYEGKDIPITRDGNYITMCANGKYNCIESVSDGCANCVLDFTNPDRDNYLRWVEKGGRLKAKSASDIMEEAFEKVEGNSKEFLHAMNYEMGKERLMEITKPKQTEVSKMNGTIYQVIAVENPAPIEVEEQGAVSKIVFGPVTILALNSSTAISKATLENAKLLEKVNQERLEVKAVPLG